MFMYTQLLLVFLYIYTYIQTALRRSIKAQVNGIFFVNNMDGSTMGNIDKNIPKKIMGNENTPFV